MSSRSFDEMDRMFEQMDQLFARMRDRLARTELPPAFADVGWKGGAAVDVYDDEEALMVVADVPGFDRDEIEITIRGTVLHISAEHEVENEHVSRSRSISERLTIPADIDVDDVSATYHNGVLEVCLPYLGDESEAHHIDIE